MFSEGEFLKSENKKEILAILTANIWFIQNLIFKEASLHPRYGIKQYVCNAFRKYSEEKVAKSITIA